MYQTNLDRDMVEDKQKTEAWGLQLQDLISAQIDTPA